MPPRSVALFQQLRRWTSPPSPDAELLDRWVRQRDEEAFAALVARHGPMVLGLCRRVLGNSHDAEDAFQAVFLILARKAGSLRHPEALAGWLHGVAVRLACKARAATSRRRATDALPATLEPPDTHPEPLDLLSARELLALIDQEIARLPEVYRLPLVLCDLEDRTQEEAARLLGWTCGSLRGRLLRGRARLRSRLTRRGLAPAALLAAGLTRMSATAAVPPELAASVSRLAVSSSPMPTAVAALMKEGMHGLMSAKLKLVSAVLLVAGAMAAGAGLLARPGSTPQAAKERPEAPPPPAQLTKKPDLRRDQFGDPLPDDAVARLGTLRFRHGGLIEDLYFGPDGKTLVSCGGWDGLRFWDAATGQEIQRFAEQKRAIHAALSPDNKRLAVTMRTNNSTDEPIEIRDFATGALLHRCGRVGVSPRLLFSPDSKVLAAFGWHPQIDLFDPLSGEDLRTLEGHTDNVWSLAFSADGKTLVSASDDRTIRFWDVATGKQIRRITHKNRIGELALSSDGKLLASVDYVKKDFAGGSSWIPDWRVRVWDAATGAELRQLSMPPKEVAPEEHGGFLSLAFSPDGKHLLAGGLDGILRIWDTATGKPVRQIEGFAGSPHALAFAPDRRTLAVTDSGSSLRLFRLADGKELGLERGHRCGVASVVMTPDCQIVVTAGLDGMRFWDAKTGGEVRRRTIPADGFFMVPQFLSDGRSYLTGGLDRRLHLHRLDTGEELAVLRGRESRDQFALSPDRKLLASAKADKTIHLIDPITGTVRHRLASGDSPVFGMSFTPDSQALIVWSADRTVTVWDAVTGVQRKQFTGPTYEPGPLPVGGFSSYTAALSPDGRLLAFGLPTLGKPGILPVVKLSTGEEVRRFNTAADGVSQLAFSADSKCLAWGGWSEGAIYLGEIASGGIRRRFLGHRGRVISLAFSPDGKTLISGSQDTTALVWDLTGRLEPKRRLTEDDLKRTWDTLTQRDAAAGYRAIQALVADPERSIPLLRTRLKPVPVVAEVQLKRWIAELGSDQFAEREKAARELEKQEEAALHALRQALEARPALEIRRRLEQLLEKAERGEWTPSPERLRTRRALEVLERAGTPEARRVLETLAGGAPGAWLTLDAEAALGRLAKR